MTVNNKHLLYRAIRNMFVFKQTHKMVKIIRKMSMELISYSNSHEQLRFCEN